MQEPEPGRVPLLPKQLEFVQANEPEVLYSGAFGAGKSLALCWKLATHAAIPRNRVGLCRKTNVSLKATTLKTLIEGEGNLPPVLPPGSYQHNKSEQSIRLHGGGEILYFGIDIAESKGSLNLGAVAVDEAVELLEADWLMLRGRCRNLVDPNRQIFGACNPGPPSHFLAQRFALAQATTPVSGCRAIQTKSTDNWFLPDDYLVWLDTLTGTHRARYRDGLWVGFEGLVYSMWDRALHIAEPPPSFAQVIACVDEGFTNPAVLLSIGLDSDGRAWVFREFYERQVQQSDFVAEVRRRAAADGFDTVLCDPSAAGLKAAIRESGLECPDVDNALFDGIRRVQDRLGAQADGRPRLLVAPGCENTIREFESYIWRPGVSGRDPADVPLKQFDHALDALRYGISYLERGGGAVPFVAAGSDRASGFTVSAGR